MLWRGGGFAARGCGEKLSWGVQHKAGQWLAEGKECGQQQNHSAPGQQHEKAKSSKKSPLDNRDKRPLILQGRFFTISIFHAHPWL